MINILEHFRSVLSNHRVLCQLRCNIEVNILLGLYREDTDPPDRGHWSEGSEVSLHKGLWMNSQPDISAGDCVTGSINNKWSFQNCEKKFPFMCRQDGAIKSKY